MNAILFISPNPIWGGAATANLAIAKMLQDNGYDVIFNDEYSEASYYNGVKIDHTPLHHKKFSDRRLIRHLIDDNHIDCIIWSPLAAIYFYHDIIWFRKRGIRQMAIVHSLSLTTDIKGRLMDFLVSITLAQMSTIVYVSQYTMDSWAKFKAIRKSKANKVVIHNVVDLCGEVHYQHIDKPRIGFVGRLSEEKQPNIFCELAAMSDHDYIVYGDGPLMSDLKSSYKGVKFKGQCNDTDRIYSEIDVLVMTSKFENCPMVILEAQSYGIPCVAPRVGGIPELIEDGLNGILYDGYKTETILTAINKVISNYSEFSSKSLECSKNHTSEVTLSKWEKILS